MRSRRCGQGNQGVLAGAAKRDPKLVGMRGKYERDRDGILDDYHKAAKDAAGFMDLLGFPFEIVYSSVYTGPASGKGGEGRLSDQVKAWHLKGHAKPKEIFVMGPKSRVEFKLSEQVSKFKGTACILPAADAT